MILIKIFFGVYTKLIGVLVKLKIPKKHRETLWKEIGYKFLKMKKQDYKEIKYPLSSFETFYDFFTREIKITTRPLAKKGLVCPADSRIMDWGKIKIDTSMRIKGKKYTVSELIDNKKISKEYKNGTYINLYLAPYNYHRFHTPLAGTIKNIKHIDGSLFPVNDWGITNVESLYSKNKRVVVTLETAVGEIKYIAVGASAVGDIQILAKRGDKLKRGAQLGWFGLGSTVILLLSNTIKGEMKKRKGASVKVRELLF